MGYCAANSIRTNAKGKPVLESYLLIQCSRITVIKCSAGTKGVIVDKEPVCVPQSLRLKQSIDSPPHPITLIHDVLSKNYSMPILDKGIGTICAIPEGLGVPWWLGVTGR